LFCGAGLQLFYFFLSFKKMNVLQIVCGKNHDKESGGAAYLVCGGQPSLKSSG